MISFIDTNRIFNYLINHKKCHYIINEKERNVSFYVNDKIFAVLSNSHSIDQLTLRFKPTFSQQLQQSNQYVFPSYQYMNSYHWSTLFVGAIKDEILFNLIEISYNLTVEKMTKKQKFRYAFDENILLAS